MLSSDILGWLGLVITCSGRNGTWMKPYMVGVLRLDRVEQAIHQVVAHEGTCTIRDWGAGNPPWRIASTMALIGKVAK